MIKKLDSENFDELISNGNILVDFYADWCGPCKMMGSVLENIDSIDILKVNVDDHEDLATRYGVMSIPTIILFKDGNLEKKNVGFMDKDSLENWIK